MKKSSKYEAPLYRYIRGYALDPGFSSKLDTAAINDVIYRVPFEPLEPGPSGEYVEVMDYDPASNCWYEPVDLSAEEVASQQGFAPSEGNPQFHQQFVYAVVMKTIWHFERALGRKVIWYPHRTGMRNSSYVQKLRIYPHGFRDANAYYDPQKSALVFGYFPASAQYHGTNYPGGLVFTCLSPDIVAHEVTHAILDSMHHRYMEDTNRDVAAFHEGFADIVALLQRFTFSDLVEHQLFMARGDLQNYNVLGELATQFGEALQGSRGALRSMIGRWKKDKWVALEADPSDYATQTEAHDRGAVLVATIFDVFQRIYKFRTRDLLSIASNGTGVLPEGNIGRDLVRRLAGEAREIAEHLLHICIRALDYSPTIDITMGDYLRALITADLDIAPEDETGYRLALIEAFRARGIFAERVNTLSVDSLRWDRPDFTAKEQEALEYIAGIIKPLVRDLADARDRRKIYDLSNDVKRVLHGLLTGKERLFLRDNEWENFLNKLGLTAEPVSRIFGQDTAQVRFLNRRGNGIGDYHPAIEVHTLRPAFRAGREGRPIEQVVVTLTQRVNIDISETGRRRPMVFRGGCTIILSLGQLSKVEYLIVKSIKSYRRCEAQKAYLNGEDGSGTAPAISFYGDGSRDMQLDFNLLHRH